MYFHIKGENMNIERYVEIFDDWKMVNVLRTVTKSEE